MGIHALGPTFAQQSKYLNTPGERGLAKTGKLEQSLPLFFTCFGVVVIPEGLSGFSLCT